MAHLQGSRRGVETSLEPRLSFPTLSRAPLELYTTQQLLPFMMLAYSAQPKSTRSRLCMRRLARSRPFRPAKFLFVSVRLLRPVLSVSSVPPLYKHESKLYSSGGPASANPVSYRQTNAPRPASTKPATYSRTRYRGRSSTSSAPPSQNLRMYAIARTSSCAPAFHFPDPRSPRSLSPLPALGLGQPRSRIRQRQRSSSSHLRSPAQRWALDLLPRGRACASSYAPPSPSPS